MVAPVNDPDQPFDPWAVAAKESVAGDGQAETFVATLPSGAQIQVLTAEEAGYLNGVVAAYETQYALENVSDLSELDRCLGLELQSHRIALFLARGCDYNAKSVDDDKLRQRLKEISMEIRQVKKTLGIDKVNRDRQTGRGSAHERISNILARAHRFGLMRNQQAATAHELAMELISLMQRRRNAVTDKERRMLRVTDDDIFEWIETVFEPEFMAVDEAYRRDDQKMWILQDT